MDNKSTRRRRLDDAIRVAGGIPALARLADLSEKYLRQITTGYQGAKDRAPRQVGDAAARKIEAGLKKPRGWMDTPTPAEIAADYVPQNPVPTAQVVPWATPADLSDDWVLVERRSIKLAAGNGTVVFEHEKLPPLAFRGEYLREKRVRSHNNLVICYAEGDSMEPSFRDRDVLLCDTGQTEIIDGEVYALDYGGELRVKRLRKRFDGGLLILSDNAAKFPPEVLTAMDSVHIKILGRVLWRGGSV